MSKEDYYIELILKKCLSFKKTKSLFISYYSFNENFVQKLIKNLPMKVTDIYLECIDPFYEHELLKDLSLKEIEECGYFDCSVYNNYARKKASFLFLTSPIPELMNDIEDEKLELVTKIKSKTKRYFVDKEVSYQIPWAIVPVYNAHWENSLEIDNLEEILYDICLVNKKAVENWDNQIQKSREIVKKINALKLNALRFENSLGTNITVGLSNEYRFEGIGEQEVLANLPSYEIFASPDKNKTEGMVYSSKPLFYNGAVVDNFFIEFKEGKVTNYGAKKGKKVLESIINFDKGSSFLGEVALVEKTSPICKANMVFKTTLLDENASSHLALGRGYGDGTKKQLDKKGINYSEVHVDFMIGTDDLKVTGIKGDEEIPIMKNGKFLI